MLALFKWEAVVGSNLDSNLLTHPASLQRRWCCQSTVSSTD